MSSWLWSPLALVAANTVVVTGQGVASAAGTSTASATAQATKQSVASSAGIGTASPKSRATKRTVASAAGTGTATFKSGFKFTSTGLGTASPKTQAAKRSKATVAATSTVAFASSYTFVAPVPAWSTTAKSAHVVLSNANETAAPDSTQNANFSGRGNTAVGASDKRYWEVTVDSSDTGTVLIGVATSSENWDISGGIGQSAASIGYGTGGAVTCATSPIGLIESYAARDTISVAVHGTKVWFRVNGGLWNNDISENPATDAGGFDVLTSDVYPAYSVENLLGLYSDQITANFGATAFTYTVPSGFTAFPYSVDRSAAVSASGTGTASPKAQATKRAAASSAGVGTASPKSQSTERAKVTAAGTSTVSFTGSYTYVVSAPADVSSIGTSTVGFTGRATKASKTTAAGLGTAASTARANFNGVASATGVGTAAPKTQSTKRAAASSVGSGTATFRSGTQFTSAGVGTAAPKTQATKRTVGTVSALATASPKGRADAQAKITSTATATISVEATATGQGNITSAAQGTATFKSQVEARAKITSTATAIATVVGSSTYATPAGTETTLSSAGTSAAVLVSRATARAHIGATGLATASPQTQATKRAAFASVGSSTAAAPRGRADAQTALAVDRASTGWYFNSAGVLVAAGVNVARLAYDPVTLALLGVLSEPERTNSIRNNTMVGAVPGIPGTTPTRWSFTYTIGGFNGITREVIGTGVEDGINYCDVRYSGLPTATGTLSLFFDSTIQIAASSGQTWSGSAYVSLVNGSLTNTAVWQYITERNSAGTSLVSTSTARTPTSAALRTQRFASTRTFNNVNTAAVTHSWGISYTVDHALDITLRFGLPQTELGATTTSPIKTSTVAVLRAVENQLGASGAASFVSLATAASKITASATATAGSVSQATKASKATALALGQAAHTGWATFSTVLTATAQATASPKGAAFFAGAGTAAATGTANVKSTTEARAKITAAASATASVVGLRGLGGTSVITTTATGTADVRGATTARSAISGAAQASVTVRSQATKLGAIQGIGRGSAAVKGQATAKTTLAGAGLATVSVRARATASGAITAQSLSAAFLGAQAASYGTIRGEGRGLAEVSGQAASYGAVHGPALGAAFVASRATKEAILRAWGSALSVVIGDQTKQGEAAITARAKGTASLEGYGAFTELYTIEGNARCFKVAGLATPNVPTVIGSARLAHARGAASVVAVSSKARSIIEVQGHP